MALSELSRKIGDWFVKEHKDQIELTRDSKDVLVKRNAVNYRGIWAETTLSKCKHYVITLNVHSKSLNLKIR